ncbi:pseudouridine synthase [Phlyctochytrium arcticum]|nr:pseudouridine synthase [Phlyctochytrium arcticum]
MRLARILTTAKYSYGSLLLQRTTAVGTRFMATVKPESAKRLLADNAEDISSKRPKQDEAAPQQEMGGIDLMAFRKLAGEKDVGILNYINPSLPGFTGILKSRFSDFQVNEVDVNGKIVHLESLEAPTTRSVDDMVADTPDVEEVKTLENGFAKLLDLVKDDVFMDKFKAIIEELQKPVVKPSAEGSTLEKASAEGADQSNVDTPKDAPTSQPNAASKPSIDKSKYLRIQISEKPLRKEVHNVTRTYFGEFLETEGDSDSIVFVPQRDLKGKNARGTRDGQKGGKFNKRGLGPREWKALGGQYLEFTLYKENRDTMNAINTLSKLLHINGKAFSYAGTKDKRAITCQKVTGIRVQAERMIQVNRSLRGMATGDYRYRSDQIVLGDLKGNHFKIVIRDVQASSLEDLERSVVSLKEQGFINYFGMQRFGTRSTPTYVVGISCLKGDFAKAVEQIMEKKDGEREEFVAARECWFKTKDAAAAYKLFPPSCMAERSVMNYYARTGRMTDHFGALESIPRNLRTLYIHAYQSLVWNFMATKRLSLFGTKPVIGDIVAVAGDEVSDLQEAEEADDTPEVTVEAASGSKKEWKKRTMEVKILETEADLKDYTMADVVLPLPGHDVKYPTNEMNALYVEFMAQHGLDPHNMARKQKSYNMPGSYRKIIGKPADFEWKTLRYTDVNADLQLTDIQRVKGKPDIQSIEGAPRLGLVLDFTLSSSQYATMALRECMKMETTAAFHEQIVKTNEEAGKTASSSSPGK